MEFKGTLVSPAYYQLYLTLSKDEVSELIEDANLRLQTYLIDEKISQINELTKQKDYHFHSFQKIKQLKDELQELSQNQFSEVFMSQLDYLIKEDIENTIDEEIDHRQMIVVGPKQINYLGKIQKDQPLSITCSFCFVSQEYELKYPEMKVAKVPISNEDIQALMDEVLIYKGYCTYQESEAIGQHSDVTVDLLYSDSSKNMYNLVEDVNTLIDDFELNPDLLLGRKIDEKILCMMNHELVQIIVHHILDKIPLDINDSLVEEIHLFGLKTVETLKKKLKQIYSSVINTNLSVVTILKAMTKINDFKIDSYVIHHFKKEMQWEDLNLLEDSLSFSDKNQENIGIQFILSIIFYSYFPEIDAYESQLRDEFEILKIIKAKVFKDLNFEEFMEYRKPFLVLHELFEKKGLL